MTDNIADTAQSAYQIWLALVYLGVAIFLYMMPAVIAFGRGHHHRIPILIVNIFAGWTLFGWVGSLAWAAGPIPSERRLSLMERALVERSIMQSLEDRR